MGNDEMTGIPTVTAAQMAQVDQIMMNELGVDTLQLMEVAGLAVIGAIRRQLGGDVADKRVLLLAGSGGNGGDALVAARHLQAMGAHPRVVLSKAAADLPAITAKQYRLAEVFGLPVSDPANAEHAITGEEYDLIVDGLLGFSGTGDPRGATAALIRFANDGPAPILAIDQPSGLDATSGAQGDPCIHATATVTLVLPKQGFATSEGQQACGEITVASIGVPAQVIARVGVMVPPALFSRKSWIRWQPKLP